jgi:hypothetical protein
MNAIRPDDLTSSPPEATMPIPLGRSVRALLPCALLLAACDTDLGSDPVAPSAVTGDSPSAAVVGANAGHATGSAFVLIDGSPERISFSAVRHTNGSATGQFELYTTQVGGVRLRGVVTCMGISGTQAWIGGIVTSTTLEGLEGPAIWTVRDNGDGATSVDQTSDLFTGFPVEGLPHWCGGDLDGIGLPLLPTTQGEIQVQP